MPGSSSIDRLILASGRRANRARTDLMRARGMVLPDPSPLPAPKQRVRPRRDGLFPLRFATHSGIFALVICILAGELGGSWSAVVARRTPGLEHTANSLAATQATASFDLPLTIAPVRLDPPGLTLVAPALQRPGRLVGAYKAFHLLEEGETLGAIAARYGISLASLIWANRLDQGDALMVGQILRIPRIAGLPHHVSEGETLESVAGHFGVAPGVIATFEPNQIGPDLQLRPGTELFIPGDALTLPSPWLEAIGGVDALANRAPEPAGIVREAETNVRTGPSMEHPRLLQLDAGRRVALRARHKDWLKVELGATLGWMRQDMLDVPAAWVSALPETNDFPAPPPRWVWPAQGVISSRFGPRWGGFHNGLDIANRAWTPIYAARAGVVREAGWCSGYGYCVRIRHEGGVETIYGHLIERPHVAAGEEVAAGERIGSMGSTYDRAGGGYSTGVHLHFTVLVNGRAVNPLRFLP